MKVCEIFSSIQGESSYAGMPCTFIRLSGCNLRCAYCDTAYSYDQGTEWSLQEILAQVKGKGLRLVEVTGGEPLLQRETPGLIESLVEKKYQVLVETNGSFDIRVIDRRAVVVLDVKTPGSGMVGSNNLENLDYIRPSDEVKFVICGDADYEWAKALLSRTGLTKRSKVLFSAATGMLDPSDLAGWIVKDALDVRLNIQAHKYIFGPDVRGV